MTVTDIVPVYVRKTSFIRTGRVPACSVPLIQIKVTELVVQHVVNVVESDMTEKVDMFGTV